MSNIAGWLERHAAERGDAPALDDGERSLDYAGLARRTARCAGVLAGAGVGRGDRVALLLGNRTAYIETVFAAARLGAMAVPLNARLTAHELAPLLADCEPRALLSDAAHQAAADAACASVERPPALRLRCGNGSDEYEAALASARPAPMARVDPGDPSLLMYTSGTTGTPKGALLPHRKTLYNARNAEIFFGLRPGDRVLVPLPLFHSFGLVILSLPSLFAGAAVYMGGSAGPDGSFDPGAVWRTVEREGIHFFGAVPTMFRALLDWLDAADASAEGRPDLSSLRFLFSAGAAIPVELIHAFEARGLVLKQGFGQTETSILCCLEARDAVRKAGSVGRAVPHAELRLVRLETLEREPGQWEEVAVGETGEIVVRGPITMTGYWRRPEATAEVLRGEWLRTGDLATRDDEGFYTLVGRARHMYISGGENVYPAEIEAVYETHPDVREVAVVGVPDERWGEVGHAYCVPEAGAEIDEAKLRAWGAERLADFKLPKRFIRVAELPRTESGKVKKKELSSP